MIVAIVFGILAVVMLISALTSDEENGILGAAFFLFMVLAIFLPLLLNCPETVSTIAYSDLKFTNMEDNSITLSDASDTLELELFLYNDNGTVLFKARTIKKITCKNGPVKYEVKTTRSKNLFVDNPYYIKREITIWNPNFPNTANAELTN